MFRRKSLRRALSSTHPYLGKPSDEIAIHSKKTQLSCRFLQPLLPSGSISDQGSHLKIRAIWSVSSLMWTLPCRLHRADRQEGQVADFRAQTTQWAPSKWFLRHKIKRTFCYGSSLSSARTCILFCPYKPSLIWKGWISTYSRRSKQLKPSKI